MGHGDAVSGSGDGRAKNLARVACRLVETAEAHKIEADAVQLSVEQENNERLLVTVIPVGCGDVFLPKFADLFGLVGRLGRLFVEADGFHGDLGKAVFHGVVWWCYVIGFL